MADYLIQRSIDIEVDTALPDIIGQVRTFVERQVGASETPIRLAVTKSDGVRWTCELGTLIGEIHGSGTFDFTARSHENTSEFNVVMLVPTGIGADIGGHAGDATPAAALLANVCDSLITHPNVFNASDMIQIPTNALYVEGSVITRMMMGTARLLRVRSNRLLVLIQSHEDQVFTNAAINAVNAARAYYGIQVTEVVTIDPRFRMISEYSPSGSATGCVEGLNYIWEALDARVGTFDAVAISSVIEVPPEFHRDYYELRGDMINPWGGVEAMLTHAISLKYGVPTAHSPMFESREIAELDLGVVDPRMAAEVVSVTFLQCVLRGLQRSPRIMSKESAGGDTVGVEAISCLVVPYGCMGLPTLAALYQGIPVIAVRENYNIMRNDLGDLAWRDDQLITVENYWEAAGVIASLRMGLDPYSVRRPIEKVKVSVGTSSSNSATPAISGSLEV